MSAKLAKAAGMAIVSLSTRAQVPVPATIGLLTAGLIGVGGVHVARRKRAA